VAGAAIGLPVLDGWYAGLAKPPGTPSAWLLMPLWLAPHVLLGLAAWLVWRRTGTGPSLRLWGWLLLADALWAPAFFGLHSAALGLAMVLALVPLLLLTLRAFRQVDRAAAWSLAPYAAWLAGLGYVNAGIVLMN
jgi:tryptophan-rich sensory protein